MNRYVLAILVTPLTVWACEGGVDTPGAVGGTSMGGAGTTVATGKAGAGGGSAACSPPSISSTCAPEAVIRVIVRLGAGIAPASGRLIVKLSHLRLGMGTSGGLAHTATWLEGATLSETDDTEVHFDMCAGGEMWSEDNCEFNLHGWLDTSPNGFPDPGEPAGRTVVNVSCHHDGAHCFELVLDCIDGQSCIAFQESAICACAANACNGAIITCM